MPLHAVILVLLVLILHSSPTAALDKSLPTAVGAIFAAYAISLVLVALTLLALANKRREHLRADLDLDPSVFVTQPVHDPYQTLASPARSSAAVRNFSYPSPVSHEFPSSPLHPPEMASQQQLDDMYRHAMEHEDARLNGHHFVPSPTQPKPKPNHLTLDEKPQSKTQSFLNAIRTPRKKTLKGVNISSPIMSPLPSPHPSQQTSRQYSPPTPSCYAPSPAVARGPPPTTRSQMPLTPEISPRTIPSIEEHLDSYLVSDGQHSQQRRTALPLVGLPRSPKPGSCFPPVSSAPKLGSVRRPSAVREGGLLPLRAYEPEKLGTNSSTTIQTILERKGPEAPVTGRSPVTAGAVPYSPYQPYTPCVPMTPSLVTKEDRKRMKKMMPKTPTTEMVKKTEEVW
ncbi:hypothetical protein CDD80_1556 [Ophiocordyceps camponoti-rufipedis]|uniref:Uncharacterized protein n=1 Tax=Ophiocordyceps camponoti-rufipedis TaxID=2004952 RepID=A0A2C5Z9L7_9HYPO|nr:hypothetical protein CDD80_1556 [Ophiocordyceps camponoti-rufipedis]